MFLGEIKRKAAQKSGFTATQQFYYTVGGVSHEISADMGLRPDEQTQALSFKTQRGETFYHRPIPMEAADSTLYALFSATPDMMVNPRAKVIIKITEALSRPEIRDRVGGEALILLQSTLQMNSSSLKPPKRTVSQQAFDDNHLDKPRGPRHGDAPDQPPHVQTPLEKAQQKAYEVYRTNSGYLGISRDPIQDRHGNQYVRVNINPDGDCCFHALGIRRADFLDRIEAYIDECEEALSNPGMGVRVQTGIQVRNLCNPLLTTAKDQEEADSRARMKRDQAAIANSGKKKDESKMMPKDKKKTVKESVETKLSFKQMVQLVQESGGQQQIDAVDKALFTWAERVARNKLGEGMKADLYAGLVYERNGGTFEMYDVLSEAQK